MKKNYITPEINEIQLEAPLCNGGIVTASVFNTKGECIDNFEVKGEQTTKTENEDLWGESHSGKCGDD